MSVRVPIVLVALLLGSVVAATPTLAAPEIPDDLPLLFVVRGHARVADDRLSIDANDVEWFTDRPERRAGRGAAPELVRRWTEFGFEDAPPNAAISGDGVDAVVELTAPKATRNGIRFDTARVRGRVPRGSLGRVTLFVDSTAVGTDCARLQAWSPGPLVSDPGPQFAGAQLQFCDVTGRVFGDGSFAGSNWYNVQFSYGFLEGSDLSGANLTNAYMYQADLRNVNLSNANLRATNLTEANLAGANLSGAIIGETVWEGTTCPDGSLGTTERPCTA